MELVLGAIIFAVGCFFGAVLVTVGMQMRGAANEKNKTS